ncbi:MAG: signal peptidase I [Halolamina sp.]|uniref:signal peptidase I n=1 Tax=Halolamina sp. TaxID=1940283 RepID=UPI002FC28C6E
MSAHTRTARGIARGGRWLLTGLFLLVVVAIVVHSIPALVGAEASYVVLSGSMHPTMDAGDVVFVYQTDPATIEAGDVVTYMRASDNIPVTHRVIEVVGTGTEPAFVTKGDANEDIDPGTVAASNVIGVVPAVTIPSVGELVFVLPEFGRVILVVQTPIGFGALIALPMLGFLTLELRDILRNRKRASDAAESATTDREGTVEATADTLVGSTHALESEELEPAADDVTLAPGDLNVATLVLVVFAGYAVFVANLLRTAPTVTAAVAVTGCAVIALSIKYGLFAVEPAQTDEEALPALPGETAPSSTWPSEAVGPSLPGIDRRNW